jgi:hypothetical protein
MPFGKCRFPHFQVRAAKDKSKDVDMMDKPDGLPASPQAGQRQQDVINKVLAA